ncbi:MAG: hypothetical protein JWP69_2419 [Flaviaesturariibacter sp.]|nr:hypothetical protein [Flaviaesturariibacter sp.]
MRGSYTFITTLLTGSEYYCYYYLRCCLARDEYKRILGTTPNLFMRIAITMR